MKGLSVFLFEWKHFVRRPFKVVALGLFVLATLYGLHNGASLYHEQIAELESIIEQAEESRQEYADYYAQAEPIPEDAPWIDMSTPFWAIWFNYVYHFKTPSPALVYSIGQAEQYGYYKRVTFWASPYDADMTQEIANPERLQTGTLDFSFAILFLLPLLLLIMLYNLKSMEAEQGFLPLIDVQIASKNTWLIGRVGFYVVLLYAIVTGLLLYGGSLTGVFSSATSALGQMFLYTLLYMLFWTVIYYLILRSGNGILGNTLKMAGIWLVFAFVVPAAVHQWVSIKQPVNLMTELIDAKRDEQEELFNQPDSVFQAQLNALFPEIVDSPVANDSTRRDLARNRSGAALANELVKKSIVPIEEDNASKNRMIKASYVFNPITFFQNRFNAVSQTHYDDYQQYRDEIQALIDKQTRTLVLDTWEGLVVDKSKFDEYQNILTEQ